MKRVVSIVRPRFIQYCKSILLSILLVCGFALFTQNLSAQSLSYTVRESISIPTDTTRLLAVRDMDGDGILDFVTQKDAVGISVFERSGSTFVERFTLIEGSFLRSYVVDEVDGDGIPEILISNRNNGQVKIWEASDNDTYSLLYTDYVGNYIENYPLGADSNANGNREFLIPRESFPSQIISLEAISNDNYTKQILAEGPGGNVFLLGTYDLDGDGLPETVFRDDHYLSDMWRCYVIEQGNLVFQYNNTNSTDFWAVSLGDTDGNGLGEIIGYNGYDRVNMRIFESTGTDNNFIEVYNSPRLGYLPRFPYGWILLPFNINNTSVSAFYRFLDDGFGQSNIFTIATREGTTITDIYNSGSLLQGFSGDIKQLMSIGDTNGDGNLELAVWQGSQIHILEQSSSDSEPPVIQYVECSPNPVATDNYVVFTAEINDTDTGNSNIASANYSIDGGPWIPMAAQDGTFDSPIEDVTATLSTGTTPAVYEVCVFGADEAGNESLNQCLLMAVYDPEGGFVTGGGWIWSEPGAYSVNPLLEGKANFGFVSKYKKGATIPTGNTEFQFKAGSLNFHSDDYDWLVVPGDHTAKYKGTGTIGDEGYYKFMIWAQDIEPDTFRIKIWEEDEMENEYIIYDNEFSQELGGGNIIIHED